MSHAFLIAAIFVPYVAFMIGLGIYIASTGRHEERCDQEDTGRPDRDGAELSAAA